MKARNLLIILICIVIFLGCGGGGGGSGVGPILVTGQISGQISFDEKLASERAVIASFASSLRASSFENALVFLEEMPTRAVYADSDGKYTFTDLPLDSSYHLIARVNSLSGNAYKIRSEEIYLGKSKAQVTQNIHFDSNSEAKYQIRLQVKDTKDNNVPKCKIWLWGEEFTLDESGCYLSPKMPLGASGILKVIPPTNKELITLECKIDSTSFQSEIQGVSAVTLPPVGITQKKAPYVSIKVGEVLSGGFALRLYGNAIDPQNEPLELEWSTSIGSFTYESIDKSYVDWGVPSEQTTAVITLKASQVSSSNYPLFWSKVELPVRISKNGDVSYPGEVVVNPVLRFIDIISSATDQITGNTLSAYEVLASFPNDLELFYNWEVSEGAIISGKNSKKMYWQSPSLKAKETRLATITAYVSDEIATISKSIVVNVTSFPVITFTSPLDTEFYPGELSFTAVAKDFQGNFIPYEDYKWYFATSTSEIVFMQNEGASFTYNFVTQGSYTVYLSAKDSSGVVGTGSIDISIINVPPEIEILSPENDSGYTSKNHLVFKAKVIDYDDGEITAPEQITWYSDIDGKIGSGTFFVNDSLTKNSKHIISVEAKDSQGAVSSTSIIIWYDMPARIMLSPENGAAFFEGSTIDFYAKGMDANGAALSSSTYKWYLDGSTTPWKTGIERFSSKDLSAGLHSVKVVGANDSGDVISNDYYFEAGLPLPNITSPVSGSRFDPNTSITFTAVPTSTGTLEMNWYIDDIIDSFGTSDSLTVELPIGSHRIRYHGMDYATTDASSVIDIIVESEPKIELNYASGAFFFDGYPILFQANCLDSSNNTIGDDNIKWYILDSGSPVLWKVGSLFSVGQGTAEGMLASGSHTVIVEATGPYGSVASLSLDFESGVEHISINSPMSDNSYEVNGDIPFEANIKKNYIPISWFVDGNLIKTTSSIFNEKFPEGIYTVKAIATDSANVTSSDEVIMSVGLFPVMDISVRDISFNKIDPANKAFFEGKSIVFVGTGTSPIDGSPVDSSLMTWDIYHGDDETGKQTFTGHSEITVSSGEIAALGQGTGTVVLRCEISEGFVGIQIKKMYFNLPLASYDIPASDTFITFTDYLSDRVAVTPSGYPDSVGPVEYEWYLDWGKPSCTKLTDSDIYQDGIQLLLKKGENYLSLVATDSLGQVSLMTKKILVDNTPILSFSPPSDYSNTDAYIFDDGLEITLEASGTAAVGVEDLSNYIWYLGNDTTPRGDRTGIITSTALGLVKGINKVTLTAQDKFGLVGSIEKNIYFGEQLPEILFPAENQSFQDRDIEFNATGSEYIEMSWRLNDSDDVVYGKNITILKTDERLINGDNKIVFGGKDSAGKEVYVTRHFNYASSSSLPKIEIKLENGENIRNAIFFTLENSEMLTINGCATGVVDNDSIGASQMDWTLYKQDHEDQKKTFNSRSFLTLKNTDLTSSGTWIISLSATDRLGFNNTFTTSFYYGYPVPKISDPDDKGLYKPSQTSSYYIVGNNINDVYLPHYWFINDGSPIGPGYNIFNPFSRGYYRVTYVGTDTAGVEKSHSVEFIVNDDPTVVIQQKKNDETYSNFDDDAKYFVGHTLTLKGIAQKCDGSNVESDCIKWLKCTSATDNGTELVSGNANPTLSDATLGEGTWYLRFFAEDKDFEEHDFADEYISSKTVKLTTGIPTPIFIGAEDGKRVDQNSSISFTVNDVSPLTGYWKVDNGQSYAVTEQSGENKRFTVNTSSLSRNTHTVYYYATDSSGKTYTAQTSILVDSGPRFTSGPKIDTSFDQLGIGRANGVNYPIIKSTNSIINLTLSVNTDSNENSISWESLAGDHNTEVNQFNRNFSIGSFSYLVTVTDKFGIATSTTLSFWVWGYQSYDNLGVKNSLVSDGSSDLFITANGSDIQGLTRNTDSTSSECGKVTYGNATPAVSIGGLFYDGSSLYTMTKPTGLTLKKWKTSDSSLDGDPIAISLSFSDYGCFIIKNSKIYITDRSNSTENRLRLFYTDGVHYVDSAYKFKKPYGIACSDSQLFVTDSTDNKVVTLDLEGNDEEKTVSVDSPNGIVYSSASNRIYVASNDNKVVYVIDSETFELLYSFSVADGAENLTICGSGELSDLYISNSGGNGKITRVRSGYTW